MTWQTIDTAPRDGETSFLAFGSANLADPHYEVVYYLPSTAPDLTDADGTVWPGADWCWATTDGPSFHRDSFTHWQPLPEPPNTTTGSQEP